MIAETFYLYNCWYVRLQTVEGIREVGPFRLESTAKEVACYLNERQPTSANEIREMISYAYRSERLA